MKIEVGLTRGILYKNWRTPLETVNLRRKFDQKVDDTIVVGKFVEDFWVPKGEQKE
ncbi:MAG: hypothetical protein K0R94_1162 [Burkholderiales bacterium]|jgi:hypothetical protein|nr:hypothetical protein [Burkholderiales bacterium]